MKHRGEAIRWYRQVPGRVREFSTLSSSDYGDIVIATSPYASAKSAQEWAVAFHHGAPRWLRALTGAPDDVAGMVIGAGETWVLLEESDSLMTTQYVCQVDGDHVLMAFLMRYERRLARFIWPPVSLLHRRVAITTMRKIVTDAEKRLSASITS